MKIIEKSLPPNTVGELNPGDIFKGINGHYYLVLDSFKGETIATVNLSNNTYAAYFTSASYSKYWKNAQVVLND